MPPATAIRSRRALRTSLAGVGLATAVVVSGCSSDADDRPAGGEAPVAMEHIHGLAVDPADGALYAGSHYGLFRVPEDGPPALVSPVQDYMGFTIAGPGRFLASGHPGAEQDGPSSVGLIESTDGGETWESLSLSGEADFHSLEVADDTVFGLNSMTGELMVSENGREWETRSDAPLADIAVNPQDIAEVVATSQEGPVFSDDGGETFEPLTGAPLLVLVDWAADGTLVGVDPHGAIYASTDAGTSWEARGRLSGPPEALHVEDGQTIYAAASGVVWESNDGGNTFTQRSSAS